MASPVAERTSEALWLAALPTPRTNPTTDRLPAAPGLPRDAAVGAVDGLPGAVTDMALSADGRSLVLAHYAEDCVSVIDVATLRVTAIVGDIREPYALAVADRVYATSGGLGEDSLVAVDPDAGVALAAKPVPASARGLAVSPSGDRLYVGRCVDDVADIAIVEVETGAVRTVALPAAHNATVDSVRVSADGAHLYAALTTPSGSAVLVVDTTACRVVASVPVNGSIGDIAADGRRVVVTGFHQDRGGVLSVIDIAAGRVGAVIPIGALATAVAVRGNRAYVVTVDGEHSVVAVVDLASPAVVDRMTFAAPVSCLAVNRDGTRLYVADYDGGVTAEAVGGSRMRAAS